jgi:hypothetical protein
MNAQIRKLVKSSRHKIVWITEPGDKISDLVSFLKTLGLNVYEDPGDYDDYGSLIVTNFKMTYESYIRAYGRIGGDPSWARETFGDKANEELNVVT